METSSERSTHMDADRHPSLYISDGNIILSAMPKKPAHWQTTSNLSTGKESVKAILFRVHKSFLGSSTFFSGMFTLPDYPDQNLNKTYDGVPVVPMSDKAEDVEVLLKFFYCPQ